MRTMTLLALFALLGAAHLVDAAAPPAVRKLEPKGVKFDYKSQANITVFHEFTSAEEMTKDATNRFADADSRAAVAKLVDFTKDKLVVFTWDGTEKDVLSHTGLRMGEKTPFVTFNATLAPSKDKHRMGALYVVPKQAQVQWGQLKR